MTIKCHYLQLSKHPSQERGDHRLRSSANGVGGPRFCAPSVATDLGCPDSVKTPGDSISLSPPAANVEAAPEAQLLVFFSPLCSLALSRRLIRPCSPVSYLPVGKEKK